jgi:hypothetical protein
MFLFPESIEAKEREESRLRELQVGVDIKEKISNHMRGKLSSSRKPPGPQNGNFAKYFSDHFIYQYVILH